MATNDVTSFDYTDLNEVDPNFQPIPAPEYYNLRIMKAERRTFTYKTGAKQGQDGDLISLTVAVVDHPEYSGRRLFGSLFPSNFSLRALRRIADATGIQQEPKAPIDTWLAALAENQPVVKVQVTYRKDREGNVVLNSAGNPAENDINWMEVQPV